MNVLAMPTDSAVRAMVTGNRGWWNDKGLIKLARRTAFKDTNEEEFDQAVAFCREKNLSPMSGQLFAFVFSKDDPKKRNMVIVTSIMGYRAIANRSGDYMPGPTKSYFDPSAKDPLINPRGLVRATGAADRFIRGGWKTVEEEALWESFAPIIKSGAEDDYEWIDTGETWPDTGKPKKKKRLRQGAEAQLILDPKKDGWHKMPDVMLKKCFDAETEVLTSSGFQRFAEVSAPILQVTDGGLEPVLATPFSQNYDGEMITLDSSHLNFSVTPNHNMVISSGMIEAGEMFDRARARPTFWIPRIPPGASIDADITDSQLALAAACLADGYKTPRGFGIKVSRERKVEMLRGLGLHFKERVYSCAGNIAVARGRLIESKSDQTEFLYDRGAFGGLVIEGKSVDNSLLLSLSRRQAKIFIDAWVFFDGSEQENGVRRFYTSRLDHLGAFEVAAIIAGYAVSNPKSRRSDISTKLNYCITVSDRDAIAVTRWGRSYKDIVRNSKPHTGLERTQNTSDLVWCVTVPSGKIIVRRNGFSMICGNCGEAAALRRAWPEDLSGLYVEEELHRSQVIDGDYTDLTPSEIVARIDVENRIERIGGPALFATFDDAGTLERVPYGQFVDRMLAATEKLEPAAVAALVERNREALREFWAHNANDALELRKILEKRSGVVAGAAPGDEGTRAKAAPPQRGSSQGGAAAPAKPVAGALTGEAAEKLKNSLLADIRQLRTVNDFLAWPKGAKVHIDRLPIEMQQEIDTEFQRCQGHIAGKA